MFASQIERIKNKINILKERDTELEIFGADSHEYILKPVLSNEEVAQFEQEHGVSLPEDYVAFITEIANGGIGPYYGLHPLTKAATVIDNEDTCFLHKPFPHSVAWNPFDELNNMDNKIDVAYEEGNEEEEERLYEEKLEMISGEEHDYGRLNLCNYGCGVSLNLIVSGEQRGIMWTDDRTNDGGLYPSIEQNSTNSSSSNLSFLDWFELWLDNSIIECEEFGE